tara:strand:- start:1225 stop:1599 length:375 start_codon:yes stop_codon:yes gene_type:complete
MMIVVFHRTNTRDDEVVSGLKHFDPVAIVNLPDWQYKLTFELTNSIEHAWWKNDRVQPIFLGAHQNAGCRSTSVGDRVMLSDGRVMEVMPFGWQYQTDDNSEYWNKVRWGFYINTNRCEHDQVE